MKVLKLGVAKETVNPKMVQGFWFEFLNENDIERIQKSAVKLILKEKYEDYHSALKLLNLDTLFKRREKLCSRFAKKFLKIENSKNLFPVRKSRHEMHKRKTEKYLIKNIETERYKKSAIPAMQKLLNDDEKKMRSLLSNSNFVTRESCFYNSISVKI